MLLGNTKRKLHVQNCEKLKFYPTVIFLFTPCTFSEVKKAIDETNGNFDKIHTVNVIAVCTLNGC